MNKDVMTSSDSLQALAAQLKAVSDKLPQCRVVAGFDGFVDEIISVVQERQGLTSWKCVPTISSFNELIGKAASRSSLREIIVDRFDAGGCAVNFGDGLARMGVHVDCFATMGTPRHPAFDDFAAVAGSCHSWGRNYGRTLAFEFTDGKLMYSAVAQLAEFDEKLLDIVLADGAYAKACATAGVIALTDWTLYPHMTACWRKLQNEVYGRLTHRPYFFIDLVDPSGRSESDIREMLEALSNFEKCGKTVLGLNGNEANILCRVLGLPDQGVDPSGVKQQALALCKRLGLTLVLIHHLKFAVVADQEKTWTAPGPFCATPKKSTGAGDRFNAGFCTGLLLGLELVSCLNLAAAVTGLFVRQARSATIAELIPFIKNWAKGNPDAAITP